MNNLVFIVNFILHLDKSLVGIIQNYGLWTYLLLFLIVFCETGLVFTPFLPGDSLIFASAALAAMGSLNVFTFFIVFFLAAVLGDTVNYYMRKKKYKSALMSDYGFNQVGSEKRKIVEYEY